MTPTRSATTHSTRKPLIPTQQALADSDGGKPVDSNANWLRSWSERSKAKAGRKRQRTAREKQRRSLTASKKSKSVSGPSQGVAPVTRPPSQQIAIDDARHAEQQDRVARDQWEVGRVVVAGVSRSGRRTTKLLAVTK
jgi:hypothetical protein